MPRQDQAFLALDDHARRHARAVNDSQICPPARRVRHGHGWALLRQLPGAGGFTPWRPTVDCPAGRSLATVSCRIRAPSTNSQQQGRRSAARRRPDRRLVLRRAPAPNRLQADPKLSIMDLPDRRSATAIRAHQGRRADATAWSTIGRSRDQRFGTGPDQHRYDMRRRGRPTSRRQPRLALQASCTAGVAGAAPAARVNDRLVGERRFTNVPVGVVRFLSTTAPRAAPPMAAAAAEATRRRGAGGRPPGARWTVTGAAGASTTRAAARQRSPPDRRNPSRVETRPRVAARLKLSLAGSRPILRRFFVPRCPAAAEAAEPLTATGLVRL